MSSNHIATIRKFYEVFTTGDVPGSDQILAADWQPLPAIPENPGGRGGQKSTVHFLRSLLKDLASIVEEVYECD